MIGLVVGSALAVTPGGFRVEGAVPVNALAVRPVIVITPNEPSVFQTTLAGRASTGRALFDASLPLLVTGGEGLNDVGVGQLRLGASALFGREHRPAALGLEVAIPIAPSWARVSAWGSNARETVPTAEALVVYQVSFNPEAPWSVRFAAGFMMGDLWTMALPGMLPSAELGVAHVVPLNDTVAVVLEGEVMVDLAPVSARVLARHSRDLSAFDVGLQLPLLAYARAIPTVQVVGQAKFFF